MPGLDELPRRVLGAPALPPLLLRGTVAAAAAAARAVIAVSSSGSEEKSVALPLHRRHLLLGGREAALGLLALVLVAALGALQHALQVGDLALLSRHVERVAVGRDAGQPGAHAVLGQGIGRDDQDERCSAEPVSGRKNGNHACRWMASSALIGG